MRISRHQKRLRRKLASNVRARDCQIVKDRKAATKFDIWVEARFWGRW